MSTTPNKSENAEYFPLGLGYLALFDQILLCTVWSIGWYISFHVTYYATDSVGCVLFHRSKFSALIMLEIAWAMCTAAWICAVEVLPLLYGLHSQSTHLRFLKTVFFRLHGELVRLMDMLETFYCLSKISTFNSYCKDLLPAPLVI